MRGHLTHGILAGALSAIAGIAYQQIYQTLFYVEFDVVVNWQGITGASMIGCVLMGSGYFALDKMGKSSLRGWMNILYAVLSFASIIPAMNTTLPLDIEFPELFPGLVVPMHFFPTMVFFGLSPFFASSKN